MRKLTLTLALIVLGFTAGAQSLNVSSAYEAQNRGYLKKAKGYIDQAAENEQTKAEPQTWFYRTLIYCKIGGEIDGQTKQGKELKTLIPTWYRDAMTSILNWKQFDKEGEYTSKIAPFCSYVGNAYYSIAVDAYSKDNNFTKARDLCDTAIQMFNLGNDKKGAQVCYYVAGIASQAAKDNDGVKKYFNVLVRNKYQESNVANVYETLFNIYKSENDTINAMKIANTFVKQFPDNYQADLLMVKGYLMTSNFEKGKESINAALAKTKNDVEITATLLCQVAGIYEMTKDFTEASAKYNESLKIKPIQFEANFGMGKMIYNRAADKLEEASNVDPNDETGLYDKLDQEAKSLFKESIQYFRAAIDFINNMPANQKQAHKADLHNCLNALKTAYARLDMQNTPEFITVTTQLQELEAGH